MHTVASPPVAYLLLAIGLCCWCSSSSPPASAWPGGRGRGLPRARLLRPGVAAHPTGGRSRCSSLSIFAFAIDVQTGVPRFWTGVGVVGFVVGSLFLYDGLSLSWITLLVGIGGVLLAFLAGMPAMVRTRFSTPTIGREWMIGEMGSAVAAVDPDGMVRGARRAVAGPHQPGHPDRGRRPRSGSSPSTAPLLEVEPEAGGAEDYRERRQREAPIGADGTLATEAPPDRDADLHADRVGHSQNSVTNRSPCQAASAVRTVAA